MPLALVLPPYEAYFNQFCSTSYCSSISLGQLKRKLIKHCCQGGIKKLRHGQNSLKPKSLEKLESAYSVKPKPLY